MDHYIDIQLKQDTDSQEQLLLDLLYMNLHKALVTLHSEQIGVSFPDYQIRLGQRLRIHATSGLLHRLQQLDWFHSIAHYCNRCEILPIPDQVKHRTISRLRTTKSRSKLKRLMHRNLWTPEAKKDYLATMYSQGLTAPYLTLKSHSTGQYYRCFIHFGSLLEQPLTGKYDTFGLSKTATIPWF